MDCSLQSNDMICTYVETFVFYTDLGNMNYAHCLNLIDTS